MGKKVKKVNAVECIIMGRSGAPGSNMGDQNPRLVGSGKGSNEDGFSLEENHTCLEIDGYYADKQLSWIDMDFSIHVDNYEKFGRECRDTTRCIWIRNMCYVLCKHVSKTKVSKHDD